MEKVTNKKPVKKKVSSRNSWICPKELQGIHFDDTEGWIKAYRSHNEQVVARSVILAFRRRYFLSQKDAASKLGISNNTLNKWENGLAKIRWKSRNDLVTAGWFKPQHFGLDVPATDFTEQAEG